MKFEFVQVQADVYCDVRSGEARYRAYVNDELFVERTWAWPDSHLEEMFQIFAPPGQYRVRYELVSGSDADLRVRRYSILQGPGGINSRGEMEIWNETT